MDNISSLSSFILANQIREILFSARVDASRKQKKLNQVILVYFRP